MRGDGSGGPATVDEIPWSDGSEPEPAIATSVPRKCKHHRDRRRRGSVLEIAAWMREAGREAVELPAGGETFELCTSCWHVFDPAKQRRGRNVRAYGKKAELHAARRMGLEPRGTSRDPEDAGGALDPAVLQSKTGPGFAPIAWIRELEALAGVAKGRPRILLSAEKPGRGSRKGGDRNARRLVTMFEDEFQALTGLDARRRNLEIVAELAERMLGGAGPGLGWTDASEELGVALAALDATPAR